MENLNPEEMILGTINKLREVSGDIDEYVDNEAYLPTDKELRKIPWSNKDILFKVADVFLYSEFKLLGIDFINQENIDELLSNGVSLDELADVLTFFKDSETLTDYIKNNVDSLNEIANATLELDNDDDDEHNENIKKFIGNNQHISEIFNTHLKGSKDTLLYLLNVSSYINYTNIATKAINTRKMIRSNGVINFLHDQINETINVIGIDIELNEFYPLLSVLLVDVYDAMLIDNKSIERVYFDERIAKHILKNNPLLLYSLVNPDKMKYSKMVNATDILIALIVTYVMEINNMFTFRIIDDEYLSTIDEFRYPTDNIDQIKLVIEKLKEHYKTKTYS